MRGSVTGLVAQGPHDDAGVVLVPDRREGGQVRSAVVFAEQ